MTFIDYYKLLGVKPTSTEIEIKEAYRKLSKKFHPDLNDGDDFFSERFKDIQIAYETLSDKNKRANYQRLYDEFYRHSSHSQTNNSENSNKTSQNYNTSTPPVTEEKSIPKKSKNIVYIIIPLLLAIGIGLLKGLAKNEVREIAYDDMQEKYQNLSTQNDGIISEPTSSTQIDSDLIKFQKTEIENTNEINASNKQQNYPIGYYMVLASSNNFVYAHYKPEASSKFDFHYTRRSEVYIHKVENGFGYVDEGKAFNAHYWLSMNDLTLVEQDDMQFNTVKENEDYIISTLNKYVEEKTHYSKNNYGSYSVTSWKYSNYSFKFSGGFLYITYTNDYNGYSQTTNTETIKFPIKDFEFPIREYQSDQIIISSLNENVEKYSEEKTTFSSTVFLDFRQKAESDLVKNLSKAFLKLKNAYRN